MPCYFLIKMAHFSGKTVKNLVFGQKLGFLHFFLKFKKSQKPSKTAKIAIFEVFRDFDENDKIVIFVKKREKTRKMRKNAKIAVFLWTIDLPLFFRVFLLIFAWPMSPQKIKK